MLDHQCVSDLLIHAGNSSGRLSDSQQASFFVQKGVFRWSFLFLLLCFSTAPRHFIIDPLTIAHTMEILTLLALSSIVVMV
jgi:hypothetical protein